jgi:TatD DNase family protein
MRLYDCHAHLADERLNPTLDTLLVEATAAGVAGILACAARLEEWEKIAAVSRREPVLGALGVHPFFARTAPADLGPRLHRSLTTHPRLVAVGEIGLDFWNGRADAALQETVLHTQLTTALELGLPVILHNRRSWGDFFGLLHSAGMAGLRGVCHCFNGSRETAREVLDRGLMVSFCGPITYPNARRLREAAAYVPLDRILTETDCPDLPPQVVAPGFSLPQHVRYILEAVAEAKHLPVPAVAAQVEANYLTLFGHGASRIVPP